MRKKIKKLVKYFIIMNLELKKFDMNMINDDKVVVLIGKRETGKSFLVKDLLYYHQDVPVGTVISGTEGANAFYSKIMPNILGQGCRCQLGFNCSAQGALYPLILRRLVWVEEYL